MQIDPSQLTAGERVQLITVVLQAWQTFQKQGHHEHASRLHVAANKLSEAHNELVHQEDAGPAEGKVAASWHAVKLPLYYLVMAVLLPLGMGVLPFEAQKDVFWSFAHLMSKVLRTDIRYSQNRDWP
ncbi:hypothetical protein WJX72_007995 [[Myrmecia] bisecta]|uniref:Uncharacterized protein n=1 Tax=[Myrmecia] bisecta TaxID=41462 RepID=A0AAW1R8E3_9CHLO